MSSHHFVKDGQEPALIIANGEECSISLAEELLAWSPLVLVLDGAYDRVLRLGWKMDVVVGDLDSILSPLPEVDIQCVHVEEQESSDLEKALTWLRGRGILEVNVIWATGQRLDHTFHNLSVLGRFSDMRIVIYDDHSKAYLLPEKFSKHFRANDKLSLIPLGKVMGIHTSNLAYPLQDESLDIVERMGTSNHVLNDGLVEVHYRSGSLIMIESRDATN